MDFKYCKLEIFLPPSHLEVLQKALQEVDAGHIGNYDSCMSVSPVTGYWRPLDGCNPYIGTNGEISCEPELKVEVTVYTENVDKTIEVVKAVGVRPCTRYQEIELEYQDMNWKKQRQKYTGWIAQIIQHEVDHCNGIII